MKSKLRKKHHLSRYLKLSTLLLMASCSPTADKPSNSACQNESKFTVVVIPDTQYYLDFTHQKNSGFALNAADLFIEQMAFVANNAKQKGGDIVFATHLGDVWQHQTLAMSEAHKRAGFAAIDNPWLPSSVYPQQVIEVETANALKGFSLLASSGMAFSVAPGNHDYDAIWSAKGWVPAQSIEDFSFTLEGLGMLYSGGLSTYKSVFNNESGLFAGKPWYVDSYNEGANSAQLFSAAGYRFLHIALEMAPKNDVIEWAANVIRNHKGLPTIVSTHDFLNAAGERRPAPMMDFKKVDASHNNSEDLWQKLISQHDQIFMVLSGHHHGQASRLDQNRFGHDVHQLLSNYQARGQAGIDAGSQQQSYSGGPEGIGDGWLRLMTFDFDSTDPVIKVRTYSTHYKRYSRDLTDYARWYRDKEQPQMSDTEFHAADDFVIDLRDFYQRFGRRAGVGCDHAL